MPHRFAATAILLMSLIALHGQTSADLQTSMSPVTGQPGRAGLNSYQSWQDPKEGAFVVSLPRGWRISLGTQRTTRLEPHYVIRAQSPDGGAQLFMDDPRIALRQVPNLMTARMGWREGSVIPAAAGVKLLLERYQPAPQSAASYIRKAVCPSASGFEGGIITGQTRDLNQRFGMIAQAEGKQIHVDAGELAFRCGSQNGYVYAITLQAWQPGGQVSIWEIYRIAGFLTTPGESGAAADAMHVLLESFQMNQQWLQSFARECNDIAGNVIRESNAITQSTVERCKQMDEQSRQQMANWKKNSDASFKAFEGHEREANSTGDSSGHDYNAQLNQKTVCNGVGDCQPVDASVTNWWFDCSGKAHPGAESGDPPPSSQSACWTKGK
ncbi:MAG TPA: hypothetical protein VMB85_17195 [Bryobacteraceae bacterium]|nr:hypothetical protein [Bryobacteraceae bacterium]